MRSSRTILVFLAAALSLAAQDAAQLTEQKCGSCHIVSNPTIEKVKHISAPPMWGVARQLKEKMADRKAFVDFVVDYALNPSKEKIVFNKAAMERFGLMPSMKGTVSENELKEIAEYLYDTY